MKKTKYQNRYLKHTFNLKTTLNGKNRKTKNIQKLNKKRNF